MNVELVLTDDQISLIAQRAAAIVLDQQQNTSPWLNADQAADYLGCHKDRIYDLNQLKRLQPHRDGRRVLFRATDLDAYLASQ